MALEKTVKVGEINVSENGAMSVRTDTVISEDGVELSRTFHRHVVAPGDDVSGEDARVQAVAAAVHTPAVVAAYQAAASGV